MERRYSRNLGTLIVALLFAGAATVATTAEAQVLTVPVDKCLAKKVKCAAKYAGALAKCDAKAASKTGAVDPVCLDEAAAKLTNGTDGCLEKAAAASDDCTNTTSQALVKASVDAYRLDLLCTFDPSNVACPETDWYRDADGDGFGDPSDTITSYLAPEGYVSSDADCDDTDEFQHPGHAEVCDGLDNDCSPDTPDTCPPGSDVHVGPAGHRYIFNFWTANGSGAATFCASHGFRLARVDDLNEASFLTDKAESVNVLVGGSDAATEGQWKWADGDALGPYLSWNTGEPNNGGMSGIDEDCMELPPDGKWNDISCSTALFFVCERY